MKRSMLLLVALAAVCAMPVFAADVAPGPIYLVSGLTVVIALAVAAIVFALLIRVIKKIRNRKNGGDQK